MSTLGKILIAFQVVLSICFMLFAGAVAFTHQTWKEKAVKFEKDLKDVTDNREVVRSEFKAFQDATAKDIKDANSARDAAAAKVIALETDREQLTKEKKLLTDEKATYLQNTSVKLEESKARLAETQLLREVNEKLQQSRDELFRLKLTQEDIIRSRDVDLRIAQAKIKSNIDEIVSLRKQLQAASITSNPADAANDVPPPEVVFGEVLEARPAKTSGSSELVEISIGKEDGLHKGHTLIVYRPVDGKNRQPKYVCQIRILKTEPQSAVAEVIKSTRTGVIQKGDHVTTKL